MNWLDFGNFRKVFWNNRLLECSSKAKTLHAFYLIGISPFIIAYYASAFYPGYLTADSLYMLFQGAGLQPLSNWHPPFITMLWGWLFSIFKSAGGIWLIQICLYLGASIFFVTRLNSAIIATISFALLLLYPPIFTNMAALWKDCWAVSTTLLCAAYALDAIEKKKTLSLFLCAALFVISSLIRIDYSVVALPFLLSAIAFGWKSKDGTRENRVIAKRNLLSFLAVIIVFFISTKLIHAKVEIKLNPWLPIAIWDIAGTEKNMNPDIAMPGYNCATSDPLVFGENRKFGINLPEERVGTDIREESKKYLKLWLATITSNPIAYAKHRICVGKRFFSLGTNDVYYPYARAEMSQSTLTQRAERSELNKERYWFYDKHSNGPMFRYWYYIAGCVVLLGLSATAKSISVIQMASFFSIIMVAARFIILPAADFRYGLWIIIGSITFAALLIDQLFGYLLKPASATCPE